MSTKVPCDSCGIEIHLSADAVKNRLKKKHGRITVEVICGVDGVWNDGNLCGVCVTEAVRIGDPA